MNIGLYRFSESGILLLEKKNLITSEGNKVILRYLSSIGNTIASTIAVGIGTTAATIADSGLKFETMRVPVALTSVDWTTNTLVFKGTLDNLYSGSIYEVGLYSLPSINEGSKGLLSFDSSTEQWDTGNFSSVNSRVGSDALRLTSGASLSANATVGQLSYDLSTYSPLDIFNLALYANSTVASLNIKFMSNVNDYFEYTIAPINSGYQIISWSKGAMDMSGAADWTNINSVKVTMTSTAGGTGILDLDGLRVETTPGGVVENVLVSRTVLPSPLIKTPNKNMDIEYRLGVTIT